MNEENEAEGAHKRARSPRQRDSIRSLAEKLAAMLGKSPRSEWPGLIAMALHGFKLGVERNTVNAMVRLERAGRRT